MYHLHTYASPLDYYLIRLANADDDKSAVIFGDDGGYVNILYIPKRFWSETLSELTPVEILTPRKVSRATLNRNGLHLVKRHVHDDWVLRIMYNTELNSWISCSADNDKSLVLGDMDRRSFRFASIGKGAVCFDICKRPNFIVTGGNDKLMYSYFSLLLL
jgi:hypothetical protein